MFQLHSLSNKSDHSFYLLFIVLQTRIFKVFRFIEAGPVAQLVRAVDS